MTGDAVTDEMLVAVADGEADEAMLAAVERAVAADPALAARLAGFRATRALLKAEFSPVGREPVPDALVRFVMSGGATPAAANAAPAAAPERTDGRRWRAALPLAASLALTAGGIGWWAGAMRGPAADADLALLAAAQPALVRALDSSPDGARLDWAVAGLGGALEIRQSFRTRLGYCRSFGLASGAAARVGGVACRQDGGWRTQAAALEAPADGALRPAGAGSAVIDGFLDAVEAGEALDATAVRERAAAGWR